MHRHGYKGRKFHRETGQRTALVKSLAESLIIHESIETTKAKAKELVPYMERLITKSKKGDLASRRQVISALQTISSAHKLVDYIAPRLQGRTSGHLRIKTTSTRRGDNAQLAKVSFVVNLNEVKVEKPKAEKPAAKTKPAKKVVAKPKANAKKPAVKKPAVGRK